MGGATACRTTCNVALMGLNIRKACAGLGSEAGTHISIRRSLLTSLWAGLKECSAGLAVGAFLVIRADMMQALYLAHL